LVDLPEITFETPGRGGTLDEIRALERLLNVTFPQDYIEFALRYAGSIEPSRCTFDVPGDVTGYFGILFDIVPDKGNTEYVQFDVPDLWDSGVLPPQVVPIIRGGGADEVCLDCRGDAAKVLYYDTGLSPESGDLVPLANTFTDFLAMLRERDADD